MSGIKFDGEKLYQIRKSKKISQGKLASEIGVSRQTIYLWETNQSLPDVEKVSKICKALEVNLPDLVNGVTDANTKTDKKEIYVNKKRKSKTLKIVGLILFCIIIVYFIIVISKFLKLNNILNKWKKLENVDSYYIKMQKFTVDRTDNDDMVENIFCETYYSNGVSKIIWKAAKEDEINSVIITDYNNEFKYVTDEKNKTYIKSKINGNSEEMKISYNFDNYFQVTTTFWGTLLYCLNPNFTISTKKDIYEIILDNYTTKCFNKDTGLLEYEEIIDNASKKTQKYYKYELNTDKDYEINLDEYTEVIQ